MRVPSTTIRRYTFSFLTVFMPLSLTAAALAPWSIADSGTKSSLRGVHNAGGGVAWASGTNGVVLRSEDYGYVWQPYSLPADAGHLDFRGVWAWDSEHAVALSSGSDAASRLYETTDGGAHWQLLFTNPDSAGFWDAIAFSSPQKGMLLGDPVNGRFVIFTTNDGGHHWSRDESPRLAADSRGESAFAASNSSLALSPDGSAFFGTGGPGGFRILHFRPGINHQRGNWTSIELTTSHHSDSAGIFSLAFRDDRHGVAIGGDYKQPNERENTAFSTADGGVTWTAARNPPSGYRSAVAWYANARAWIAVGPNGSDVSYDDGKTWTFFDKTGWNAISLPWVVGPNGLIAMLKKGSLRSGGRPSSR